MIKSAMTQIRTTRTELLRAVEAESDVWLRMAAQWGVEDWMLRVLELTSGSAPPNWHEIDWRYPDYVFFAGGIDGPVAAEWLGQSSMPLGDIVIPFSFQTELWCERRESQWRTSSSEPLPWPTVEWQLTPTTPPPNTGSWELVADGMPYFTSADMPTADLLGVPYTGFRQDRAFLWRQQDTSGRLASIVIDAVQVTIEIDGENVVGANAELSSSKPGPITPVSDAKETIRFPLPEGLPDLATVVLRRGDHWLDRRPIGWGGREAQEGVEFVVPPENRLQALVVGGEDSRTEFKAHLPAESDDGRRKVMKTVAAFANGTGGTILFGVTNDGEIVGLPAHEDNPEAEDRLTQLVTSWVHPLAVFEIEKLPVPDDPQSHVLALTIEPGEQRPYGAGTMPENITYFVRRGATTFAVMPEEVRALTLRDQASGQQFPRSVPS
jgi:Schlafen, AlbA_2